MKEKEFLPYVEKALGIASLNLMQRRMLDVVAQSRDIVLLSPTGSGKTLAFVLPVLKLLRPSTGRIQTVVIAPSRELVIQIAGIFRKTAPSVRCVEVYGGHKVEDEVNSLKVVPDVLVGTPGRILDHAKRGNIDLWPLRICVLDEFDKTLELGFEQEVSKIFKQLKNLSRIILTSATAADSLPNFIKLNNPLTLNFLSDNKALQKRMKVNLVRSDATDKLDSLLELLRNIAAQSSDKLGRTIVFVNHRESAERVDSYLKRKGVSAVLYHGALDQTEREKAVASFRSGARNVMVSTDLGARGLDIEAVHNVIHYHLPLTQEAYTHRNGRTARVDAFGSVYVMLGPEERLPEFIKPDFELTLQPIDELNLATGLATLTISGGKREKLSKGDILGWLTKDLNIPGKDVGTIYIADHYSLVSLPEDVAMQIVRTAKSHKIKGVKRPVHLL
ncbi:MAG: DEAD/DEAH box helicase [Prevotella sp.]|nr:DEAD/DEAH box helicase [Prevotella sp.]MCM1075577.1 DEAD/DEAH box helicase [Ruminococcus sp.]